MEGIVIHLAVQLWAARFGVRDQNPGLMTRNLIAMPGRTSLCFQHRGQTLRRGEGVGIIRRPCDSRDRAGTHQGPAALRATSP